MLIGHSSIVIFRIAMYDVRVRKYLKSFNFNNMDIPVLLRFMQVLYKLIGGARVVIIH